MKILNKKKLIFLVGISTSVRLLFFIFVMRWGKGSWFVFDSQQYHDLAINIARGMGVVDRSGVLNFYRLPGYPLWLSFWYWLTNINVTATLIVQVVVTSIVPALMTVLAFQFFQQKKLAWFVGIFSVVNVGFVLYTGMIATEGLFLIILILFYIIFFRLCDFNVCSSKEASDSSGYTNFSRAHPELVEGSPVQKLTISLSLSILRQAQDERIFWRFFLTFTLKSKLLDFKK